MKTRECLKWFCYSVFLVGMVIYVGLPLLNRDVAYVLESRNKQTPQIIQTIPSRDIELLDAIAWQESRNGTHPDTYLDKGKELGLLQIMPIMVEDLNRIYGYRRYTLDDRRDDRLSVCMFWDYVDYYSPGASRETIARRWKGGPRGDEKQSTADYWDLVRSHLTESKGKI